MSTILNPNSHWCRVIAQEIVALGINTIVVSPGTRSAALVSAFAERTDCSLFVLTDERSAGFFALGMLRALGKPTAVCVTSGSAVANLMPALAEAHANGMPLVALTCDRPKIFRSSGQPQTTRQAEFCLPLLGRMLDLEDPSGDEAARDTMVAAIRSLAPDLEMAASKGPVQINIPLLGRMTSVDGAHGWDQIVASTPPTRPGTAIGRPDPVSGAGQNAAEIVSALHLRAGMKGVIVVGPDESMPVDLISKLARRTGFPVLADAPGSLRRASVDNMISEADFLVTRREFAFLRPDLVIRIGPAPVASTVQYYVANCRAPTIQIDRHRRVRDFLSTGTTALTFDDREAIEGIGDALHSGDSEWTHLWTNAAMRFRQALPLVLDELDWSEVQAVAQGLARVRPDFVHLANSLSIRLANMLITADCGGPHVYANRGVSGIDGTIATFFGELAATQGNGLLILGDLAALHDMSSLEAARNCDRDGIILLLNNSGGGLFDLLPVRTVPSYQRLIRHRVDVDFSAVARAFGLGFARCAASDSLRDALDDASQSGGLHLIEACFAQGGIRPALTDLLTVLADRAGQPSQTVGGQQA